MEGMSKSTAARLILLCVVFVIADAKLTGKPATSYFTICPRDDTNELEECVKNNMIELKPRLKKGFPGLGVIPLEPLVIPKMEFNDGGMFSVDTKMTNLNLWGVTDFTVNSVKMQLDDESLVANISINMPDFRIDGDYQMDGRILMIPISGNGNFEINTTDLNTELTFVSKTVNKNGKMYFSILDTKCNLILNGVTKSRFYNLFNGQKILGDATNTFLNENYKEIGDAVKHLPEGAFAKIYKDLISKVFDVYQVDEIFTTK